jgi:hypothetical protein
MTVFSGFRQAAKNNYGKSPPVLGAYWDTRVLNSVIYEVKWDGNQEKWK